MNSEQDIRRPPKEGAAFPVVGVGASAGGLRALETLFRHLPSDTGMAYVVIQHLEKGRDSLLQELISKQTLMPVREVTDGVVVEPNQVYVIPPDRDMRIEGGRLILTESVSPDGVKQPIDVFFRSLAQEQADKCVCVILSGTGTDGTLGVKSVKAQNGLCMAQDPDLAQHPGMPKSAIDTGLVDCVDSPERLAEKLVQYATHGSSHTVFQSTPSIIGETDELQRVFYLLRSHTGYDFSFYKHQTVARRIARRMARHEIAYLNDYVRYLKTHPNEVEKLFLELLIGVTSFFRDPEGFDSLRDKALNELFNREPAQESLRIWAPGSSTGEEAFTLAMIIQEMNNSPQRMGSVTIFGTDLDKRAIDTARKARYPVSIADDVPDNYLERYFARIDSTYIVKRSIRDMVVFSQHNVIEDPPFSNLDLIVCRNLLICMTPELQTEILRLFHYALRDGGYLFLGPSETVGDGSNLFKTIDSHWRIFKRLPKSSGEDRTKETVFPLISARANRISLYSHGQVRPGKSYKDLIEQWLMESYAPPSVLIDDKCEILYFIGDTSKYLKPQPGEPKFDLFNMATDELKMALISAVRKALAERKPVTYPNMNVGVTGSSERVNVCIEPIKKPWLTDDLLVVSFETVPEREGSKECNRSITAFPEAAQQRINELELDLSATREFLKTTVEELEVSNYELRSTNQELQSSNEQLQTSKQELEALNRKITRANDELKQKMRELSQADNDMTNIIVNTDIGLIFLDKHLYIKRFTPAAKRALNLIDSDVGRPVTHIASNLQYPDFKADLDHVLKRLEVTEKQIKDVNDGWLQIRIAPYMTTDKSFDGLVISFVDITTSKNLEQTLRDREERLSFALAGGEMGLWDHDMETNEVHFNKHWCEMLGYSEDEIGSDYDEWQSRIHPDDKAVVMELLNRHMEKETDIFEAEHRLKTKEGQWKWILTRGKVTERTYNGEPARMVGIHMDITRLKEAEQTQLRTIAKIDDLVFILDGLFGASPHQIILIDLSGKCMFANRAAVENLDFEGSNPIGSHVSEFGLQVELFEDFERTIAEIMAKPEPEQGKTSILTSGKRTEVDYGLLPIKDKQGNVVAIVVSFQLPNGYNANVSSSHPFAEALNQCVEKSGAVLWATDRNDPRRIAYVSREFESVWDRPPEQVTDIKDGHLRYAHKDDYEEVKKAYEAFIEGKQKFDITYRIVRRDGTIRWIWDRAFDMDDKESGSIYAGLAIDVTTIVDSKKDQ